MDKHVHAARGGLQNGLGHQLPLLGGHVEHLARGSAGIQAVHALLDQELHLLLQGLHVHLVVLVKGGGHRGDNAFHFFHIRLAPYRLIQFFGSFPFAVYDCLGGHHADVVIGLHRLRAGVGGTLNAGGVEDGGVHGQGLLLIHVQRRPSQVPAGHGVDQGLGVHQGSPGRVDEIGALLHLGKGGPVHDVPGGGDAGHMDADDVALGQHRVHVRQGHVQVPGSPRWERGA